MCVWSSACAIWNRGQSPAFRKMANGLWLVRLRERKWALVEADVRGGGMCDEPKERLRRRLSSDVTHDEIRKLKLFYFQKNARYRAKELCRDIYLGNLSLKIGKISVGLLVLILEFWWRHVKTKNTSCLSFLHCMQRQGTRIDAFVPYASLRFREVPAPQLELYFLC